MPSTGLGSEWFWHVLAAVMVVALAWAFWLFWQLTPRSAFTELAFSTSARRAASSTPPPSAAVRAHSAPPAPKAEPVGRAHAAPAATRLRLATELDMVRLGARAATVPASRSAPAAQAPVAPALAPATGAMSAPPKPDDAEEAQIGPVEPQASLSPTIENRDTVTLKEKAQIEYGRGAAFVKQGRVSEAMAALRAALGFDPGHEAARQALVSLLLEARRSAEVEQILRDGLAHDPSNIRFSVPLARLLIQRGDAAGALAMLQAQGNSGGNNPEFLAFRAALEQRQGNHREAVEAYRAALAIFPGSGNWWVGLGISQMSLSRKQEALESFRRAQATGKLAPELASFVDQRIRQLQ
ncbi:MAG: tetratricopeptide repeat protein [Burkholderiales bacterium]|nr:tetratricopeptide repeat protein [Burkholderiales bacterium]